MKFLLLKAQEMKGGGTSPGNGTPILFQWAGGGWIKTKKFCAYNQKGPLLQQKRFGPKLSVKREGGLSNCEGFPGSGEGHVPHRPKSKDGTGPGGHPP